MHRSALAPLAGIALLTVFAGCEQPPTHCFAALSAYSPFTARLSKVAGEDCADHPTAMFLGVETYVVNPTKPGDGKNSVALKAQEAGEWIANGASVEPPVVDGDESHKPYALGKFKTKYPNAQDICTVPELSVAEVTLAEVPAHEVDDGDDEDSLPDVIETQPAVEAIYEWHNVQVYVTAADTGTQLGGELTYTKNGCTAEYKVTAVSAVVSCDNGGKPDESMCEGGASANFGPLTCDPNLLHCVLKDDFPSLN